MNDFSSPLNMSQSGLNKSRIPRLLGNSSPGLFRSQSLRSPRNKTDPLAQNNNTGSFSGANDKKSNNNNTMPPTSSTVPSMRNLQKTSFVQPMGASLSKPGSLRLRCTDLDSVGSTPSSTPDADDAASVKSFGSGCSAYSLDGFNRGHRKKNGILHCQTHYETQDEYLTPTQRKDRLIRQLKAQLMKAKREIEEKDLEISRLTQEIVEMQLAKTGNQSPTSLLTSTNLRLGKENDLDMCKSCDSGHFEDDQLSKETESKKPLREPSDKSISRDFLTHQDLQEMKDANSVNEEIYKIQINNLKRYHNNEYQEMKEKYNDKIENLLHKLSDANARYFDLRPQLECCHDQIRKLQSKIDVLELEREEQEKRHHQMYLKMYKKGQEAARFEHADEVLEFAHQAPNRVAVPELLQQLHFTENELEHLKNLYRREIYKKADGVKDAEVTLRFLKDAIYCFLTDKDNRGHLRAIESIMGYSDIERVNIERALLTRSKLLK